MKQISTLLLCLVTYVVTGQAEEKPKEPQYSNTERFSIQSGKLIQKEYSFVSEVKKCTIQILTVKNLITGDSMKAVNLEYMYRGQYTSDTKSATLDSDELDALIESLKVVTEKIKEPVPSTVVEITFTSRSGFKAGCFNLRGKWLVYVRLEQFDTNSVVYMDEEDLGWLVRILGRAKERL